MPIRPENRPRYPRDWKAISARIRERDGNACKWCLAPDRALILRVRGSGVWAPMPDAREIGVEGDLSDAVWLVDFRGEWRNEHGQRMPRHRAVRPELVRVTRVVLTVAHLDHTPENCDESNLAALCQRCHLGYDMATHVRNARETRERKRGQIPLPLEMAVVA